MWDKYSEIIIAIITMISSLLAIYLKHLLDTYKKSKTDVVLDSFVNDKAVLDKLGELLDDVNGDRIYITEFHNGGKFYTGRSMQKFSMTYEICRPGVSHEQQNYQNVLNTTWHDANKMILENNEIYIEDIDTFTGSEQMKNHYLEKGTQSIFCVPIQDLNKKLIGTLCVNFTKRKCALSREQLSKMKITADILSGYL